MIRLYDYPIDEAGNEIVAVHLSHVDARGALYDVFSTAEHILLPATSKKEAINTALSYRQVNKCADRPVVVPYYDEETVEFEKREVKIQLSRDEWSSGDAYNIAHRYAMKAKLEDGWKPASVIRWGDISRTQLNGKVVVEEPEQEEQNYGVSNIARRHMFSLTTYPTLPEALEKAKTVMSNSPTSRPMEIYPKRVDTRGQLLGEKTVRYDISSLSLTSEILAYRKKEGQTVDYSGHIIVLSVVDSAEYILRGTNE